jgi:uncharacterized membrane protein
MRRLLERSFPVEAPAERAWAELIAAERWPRWAGHLRSVELSPPGPVGPATRARLRLQVGASAKVRVIQFEEGRRFRWDGSFLWMRLGYDHRVATDDAGRVQITFTVDGAGPGAATLGRLFASLYARNLDRAIPRLQALLRSPDAAPS